MVNLQLPVLTLCTNFLPYLPLHRNGFFVFCRGQRDVSSNHCRYYGEGFFPFTFPFPLGFYPPVPTSAFTPLRGGTTHFTYGAFIPAFHATANGTRLQRDHEPCRCRAHSPGTGEPQGEGDTQPDLAPGANIVEPAPIPMPETATMPMCAANTMPTVAANTMPTPVPRDQDEVPLSQVFSVPPPQEVPTANDVRKLLTFGNALITVLAMAALFLSVPPWSNLYTRGRFQLDPMP